MIFKCFPYHTDEISTSTDRYMALFDPRYSARWSNLLAISSSSVGMFSLMKNGNISGDKATQMWSLKNLIVDGMVLSLTSESSL